MFFFSKSLSYFKDEANKPNPLIWSWFHSSSNHFSSLYRNLRYAFNTKWWWNLFTKFRLDTNLLMTTHHKNTTFFPTPHGQITTPKFINTQDPSQATNQGTLDYHHFSFYYHQWIKIHISHDFSFSFYSWTRFSLANTLLQFPHRSYGKAFGLQRNMRSFWITSPNMVMDVGAQSPNLLVYLYLLSIYIYTYIYYIVSLMQRAQWRSGVTSF